jgi:hypothetical protein
MTSVDITRKCPTCLEKFSVIVTNEEFIPVFCSSRCEEILTRELGLQPDESLSAIPSQIDPHLALVRHGYFRRVRIIRKDIGKKIDKQLGAP